MPPAGTADATARRRPSTLAALIGILALIAIGLLIAQARGLSGQIEAMREVRSDNRIWVVAQFEVDLSRLQSALLAMQSGAPASEAALRLDILLSRANLLNADRIILSPASYPDAAALIARIRTESEALGAEMDAWPDPVPPQALAAALDRVERLRPDVRALSLAILAGAVAREQAERDAVRALLGRFVSLAILLVVLLTGVVLVIFDLYRDLGRQVRAARRIGSTLGKTIEAARDAVVVCDGAGRIRSVNAAAERMFGHARADAVGQPAGRLLLAEGDDAAGVTVFPPPQAPGAAGGMATGQRADGSSFPMEVSRIDDTDSDGEAVHFVILRDMSDRVAAEAGLRAARDAALQSAAERARFLAVVSHEMRTPLNGVIAALDLLRQGPMAAARRRLVGLAATSAQTALRQIEDLLDLHRQEGTGASEPHAPFDPAEALRDAVEIARAPAAQRGNRLVLDLPADGPGRVLGPPRAFARVAANLLSNAVKFTRDGSVTVALAASPPDAGGAITLTVTVTDTGPGIDPADQSRIFEDFETVDRAPSGGSGLGLGIARRAVRDMGGTLTLDSAPGRGTTFRFTARVLAAAKTDEPAVPAAIPPLHILLAEDDPINSHLMQEMLHRLGHSSVLAADGAAAVAAAGQAAFDAILLDIAMPGLDGLAALAAIRARPGPSQSAPALVVTAQAGAEEEARIAATEGAAILLKPLRLDALGRALAALVAPPHDPLLDRAVLRDARRLLGPAAQVALFARFAADLAADLDRPDTPDSAYHRAAGAAAILGARRLHRLLAAAGGGQRDIAAIRAALRATEAAYAVAVAARDPAPGSAVA